MRYLIDGYNLMHALGIMPRTFAPGGLRKVRLRFLNDLAHKLGATDAHLTTVVFDAQQAPAHLPSETSHKGLRIEYAVDVGEADERIEELIRKHSAPRSLTVVSSDLRIRLAAKRRRAVAQTAEDFWSWLEQKKEREKRQSSETAERPVRKPESARDRELFLQAFGEADELLRSDPSWNPARFAPTDEEIARIKREVEDEP